MSTVEILGTAQDAGVPHLGCRCGNCEAAREAPGRTRYASAIRLEDGGRYLFDATPDVRFQLADVPDGAFLTHAHLGHLTGLLYFGRESVDADELPVYATPGLGDVIRENEPLYSLVEDGNVDLRSIDEDSAVPLTETSVTPFRVDHRETLPTGTLAYRIDGPNRSLLYVSDVDSLTERAESLIRDVDVALVDGTFWSRDEIDRVDDVPHPTVRSSMDALADADTEVLFTHLNHTNPLLDPGSDARERLESAGFRVADRGDSIDL
ncbi:pyrroloquinoline quinone biosynthesis protein B [Halorubrum aquaticum]|uniref:Pyrroloquinoline quinone biosynthesis protein B n=1 Tax=Halorubrum aquaticum TaxID=387340 RepID=A0A1I2Z9L4_9EURY|nr:MBL fold metallo-hydrolase [Halorubrum aquaticum]SFH34229.1 pyrroloquinoline quinone biosynthesis protein B [Halorubrum aquaticum]